MQYPSRSLVRGTLLSGLVAASLVLAGPAAAETRLPETATQEMLFGDQAQDPYLLAVRAFVWGFPLVEAAKIRLRQTQPENPHAKRPPSDIGAPINAFGHGRVLSDPNSKMGVGPNNDTLYSLAWLDLADGPFVFEAPDFGDRYYTFSMLLADSSSDLSYGQRTHGAQLPPLFIYGPGYTGPVPEGMLGVASTTRYFEIAGRTLIRGKEDLPAVHALQDKMVLRTWKAYKAGSTAPNPVSPQRRLVDPANPTPEAFRFLEMLGHVLRDWIVPAHEQALVGSLRAIGLSPEKGFRLEDLDEATRAAVLQGLADARKFVDHRSKNLGINANGWTINYSGPRFGDDYLLRAGVAKDQIYVAIPEEALYPIGRVDAAGQPLHGNNSYRIRMERADLPPVKAFWSITLYDDHGMMVENPINRYSIGDRTADLITGEDGSVEILLQHLPPAPNARANWLPAPKGPFYLMMRLYVPEQAVLDRRWLPPRIERIK